jgi:hypothetical protein
MGVNYLALFQMVVLGTFAEQLNRSDGCCLEEGKRPHFSLTHPAKVNPGLTQLFLFHICPRVPILEGKELQK